LFPLFNSDRITEKEEGVKSIENGKVTFSYKDYRASAVEKEMRQPLFIQRVERVEFHLSDSQSVRFTFERAS